MIIGVIAEGPTDVVTLEVYLEEWFRRHFPRIPLQIRSLQPEIDATSGNFSDGGWTWVKTWCENNSSEDRTALYLQPVFENEQPCDILLILLDGDVVDEYTREYPDIQLPPILNAEARGLVVEEVLTRWLWGSYAAREQDLHANQQCLGKAVQALETWFVAGLDQDIEEPEEVTPDSTLLDLVPSLPTRTRGGRSRLRKTTKRWRRLAECTKGNVDHIRGSCPHFRDLLDCIEADLYIGVEFGRG